MRGLFICTALAAGLTVVLSGCGDGDNTESNGGGSSSAPGPLTSYVGTTGVFVAWADGATGDFSAAATGSYAGKRQVLRGTVDPVTGADLGQLAGVEIYKYRDGHIYALDMTSNFFPSAQQVSSESAATIDDTCSLNGTQVTGANYDYLGVNFVADLNNPTNSRYLYRLPGPDGVCNTADDIIQMVSPSMSSKTAPITLPAMPTAVVHDSLGGISGFVIKSGASLVLYDANFANPVVLGTFKAPMANSMFATGGEYLPWPLPASVVTQTALETVFQVQNLSPVTVSSASTGYTYTMDGASGGTVVAIDTSTNQAVATLGTIPTGTATFLTATFRASDHSGFIEASTYLSTQDPATRDLYLINSQSANSLLRVTGNL